MSGVGVDRCRVVDGAAGTVTFQTTGTQRLRIQTRQDGVRIDQVVISPQRYLTSAPGPATERPDDRAAGWDDQHVLSETA